MAPRKRATRQSDIFGDDAEGPDEEEEDGLDLVMKEAQNIGDQPAAINPFYDTQRLDVALDDQILATTFGG